MNQGEVWRVRLPPSQDHVQTGERPAVLIQNDLVGRALPTVLIVPFTGSGGANRFPGTVPIQPDGKNGLTGPSVALVFQARALDRRRCLYRLGIIDPQDLAAILATLADLTAP
jgi:mRNA interferase MazF